MKKISLYILFLASFSLFSLGSVFADQNWDDFINRSDSCILGNTGSVNLITQQEPPYIEYDNKDINTKYNQYFKNLNIGQNFTDSDISSGPFDKAKILYKETQNLIFNCAILNSKLKIGQKVLDKIDSKGGGNSNNTKKIKDQNKNLTKQINDYKCSNFSKDDDNIKFKMILLDNVSYQYCIYRNYLEYMKNYTNENVKTLVKDNSGSTDTKDILNKVNKLSNDISSEIIHSKTVYNQALIAYSEFENTYGIHLMLMFIYDDYIAIRGNLEKTLAPLSQLFYKIPNAQKQ